MPHLVPNPARLVVATRNDEPGASAELVRRWLPVVLGWCNRLCGPKVNPEDAAQDVLMKALTSIHDIRQPDRFAGWLFQVTRSVIRQRRRSAWVRGWIPGAGLDRVDPSADPLAHCEDRQTLRRVRLALEGLPTAQREAIVLCDLEQRSTKEAAELLQISVGTLKSRLRLGRARLRSLALRMGLEPTFRTSEDGGSP